MIFPWEYTPISIWCLPGRKLWNASLNSCDLSGPFIEIAVVLPLSI
jgi:hypothetical protein